MKLAHYCSYVVYTVCRHRMASSLGRIIELDTHIYLTKYDAITHVEVEI